MKEKILKSILETEKLTSSKEWINSLDIRKKEEADFHDFQHDHDTELGNEKFYKTTIKSQNYFRDWIKSNVKNKIVLDYACGNGEWSLECAKNKADLVIGIDISPGSINNAKNLFKKNNIKNDKYKFYVGDCEKTGLPDECVDVIICAGMLHHLDLNFAYPEMNRILKKGGRIIAGEALNYNPIIKAYRYFTPEMRTNWEKEHILSMKDVKKAEEYFKLKKITFWHITSFLAAFLGSNSIILFFLNSIDSILTKIPGVRLLSWQFFFELKK